MSKEPINRGPLPADDEEDDADGATFDAREYDALMQLERLESLEEEMIEVGVTTIEELRERIARLHQELDAAE